MCISAQDTRVSEEEATVRGRTLKDSFRRTLPTDKKMKWFGFSFFGGSVPPKSGQAHQQRSICKVS